MLSAVDWAESHVSEYEILNLGNCQGVSLTEMIHTVAEAVGVEPRIEQLPMQPGDVMRTYADITRAKSILGYEPTTEFRMGVRRFLEWYDALA